MMIKDKAGQEFIFFAFNRTTNLPVTGDAANISVALRKDTNPVVALTTPTVTELSSTLAPGFYRALPTQAETNAEQLLPTAKSTTSNVVVISVPGVLYTQPEKEQTGGGILAARVAVSSMAPRKGYMEIVQGEEKIITFIVEADGRFDVASADEVSVKLQDPSGTLVTIEDENIERILESTTLQVIQATLTPEQTASLIDGLLKIEIAFDTQKAFLKHSIKITEAL